MENTKSEDKPKQKNAILMALANILIFGSPYLALHRYGRFFLAFFLLILSLFLFPPASLVVAVAVIIDTYLIALNRNKEGTQKDKKTILNILGVLTIVASIALYTVINSFPEKLAWSSDSCKMLYLFNDRSQSLCFSHFKSIEENNAAMQEVEMWEQELAYDLCKLLSVADAAKTTGLPIDNNKSFVGYCDYRNGKNNYFAIIKMEENILEYEKEIPQNQPTAMIQHHDEIQKGSFLATFNPKGVKTSEFFFILNGKVHLIFGNLDANKNPYLSDQAYLNLAKAILEGSLTR